MDREFEERKTEIEWLSYGVARPQGATASLEQSRKEMDVVNNAGIWRGKWEFVMRKEWEESVEGVEGVRGDVVGERKELMMSGYVEGVIAVAKRV